jgi:hypothetical protein
MEKLASLYTILVYYAKWCFYFGKRVTDPKKISIELAYDPAVLLLSIYQKEMKARSKIYTYTHH